MRAPLLSLLLGGLLCLTAAPQAAASEANEFYSAALKLYGQGEVLSALEELNYALEIEPGHTRAKALRRSIMARHGNLLEVRVQQKRLEELILPEVRLKNATFTTAIAYLRDQAMQASGGSYAPNFVLQAGPEYAQRKVTLEVTSIPLSDALRYLCDMAGLRYRPDKHAIIISPPPSVGETVSSETSES